MPHSLIFGHLQIQMRSYSDIFAYIVKRIPYFFRIILPYAVRLRKNSPFAKDLPEDIFLNYVLHIRVNEEDLCDCRQLFYGIDFRNTEGYLI